MMGTEGKWNTTLSLSEETIEIKVFLDVWASTFHSGNKNYNSTMEQIHDMQSGYKSLSTTDHY